MSPAAEPPPLPRSSRRKRSLKVRLAILLSASALFFCLLVWSLLLTDSLRLLRVRADDMAPSMLPGDRIFVENLSARAKRPVRGDLIVFRADHIEGGEPGKVWVKRVVGEPGDKLRLNGSTLFVNEVPVALKNSSGEIHYLQLPSARYLSHPGQSTIVPFDCYFVLGDNSPHSFDSRYWGFLPAKQLCGRVWFRMGPFSRAGGIQ